MEKKLLIQSAEAMMKLGEFLGERARPGDLFFLSGELGAGKTTLVKGIAKGLKIESDITSPTFQLLKTYQGKYRLNHLDLYRLGSIAETEILEPEELTENGVTVIEWGDILKERLFNEYLEIQIDFSDIPDSRNVILLPSGSRYRGLVEELNHADFGT